VKSEEERQTQVVGVGWYRREQWPLLRAEAVDPAKLEDTYDEWLRIGQKLVLDLATAGVTAKRVDVDVNHLVAWCHESARPLDAAARAEYVTRKLRDEHEHSGDDTT